MTDHRPEWDPTTFSPDALVDKFARHCDEGCPNKRCPYLESCPAAKGGECPCGDFLAPHRFLVCLGKAVWHAQQLLAHRTFSDDVEEFLRGALNHVWSAHITGDGGYVDEVTRMDHIMQYALSTLGEIEIRRAISEMLLRYLGERVAIAVKDERDQSAKKGHFFCGAPFGEDDRVMHIRLTGLIDKDSWEEAMKTVDCDQEVCEYCHAFFADEVAALQAFIPQA